MLTLKILATPRGNPSDTQEVGTITIENIGGSEHLGNYKIELNGQHVGDVNRFERKRFGVWYLVEKAIGVALRESGMGQYRKRMPVVDAVQWFPDVKIEGVTLSKELDEHDKQYGTFIRMDGGRDRETTMEVHPGDFIVGTGFGRLPIPEAMVHELYERVRE